MKIINSRYSIICTAIFFTVILYHCDEDKTYLPWCNHSIKGSVYDETTYEPISQASIKIWIDNPYVHSDTLYYLTDPNGTFQTEKIGDYLDIVIEASKKPEYKTETFYERYEIEVYDTVWPFEENFTYYTVEILLKPINLNYRIIPDTLNFINDLSSLSLSILNTGTGQLEWQLIVNDNWITTDIESDTIPENEFDIINVQLNRSLLNPGNFSSSIHFISNAGNKAIPVYVSVE